MDVNNEGQGDATEQAATEQDMGASPDPALTNAVRSMDGQPNTSEDSLEETPAPTGGLNDLTESDIDDPQLRSLGTLLVNTVPGLDIERALGHAISYMDEGLIDERYIREVAGKNSEAVLTLATQIVQASNAVTESTLRGIHESAGGEANWDAAVSMFNKHASKHMRAVAAEMLDSKNFAKIKDGASFILDYARQNGGLTQRPEYQSPSSFQGDASQALSKSEFQQALRALKPEHMNPNWAQERAELFRRRTLGKQVGK